MITWLHLSDWHQQGKDFGRRVVRDALLEDIRGRATIDGKLGQIEFIIFSGDAAWKGGADEFEAAREHLFDPVLAAVGLPPERLFFVPGNHDLDRSTVEEFLPSALQKPLTSDAEVERWLTSERHRSKLLEPFEAYTTFVISYTGQDQPAYTSIKSMKAGSLDVALVGLNSSWMCGRNKDGQGRVNDYGVLSIGEPQIHEALQKIAGHDLRIIVVHHAFEWLAEFDRSRVEDRMTRGAHFILYGHEHRPRIREAKGTAGNCVMVPGGAAFEARTASNPRYTNAYNFACLDPSTGRGVFHLRRWSDVRTAWIEDTETHPRGRYEFRLPSALHRRARKPRRGSDRTNGNIVQDTDRVAIAANRYRELMLEACDIIDLANLPEQERQIAERQLELRRLYVPLRVRVEATAAATKSADTWDALEDRRYSTQLGIAEDDEPERRAVGERLVAARRLVILGDPGAGKTTLTRWIATAYLLRLKSDPAWQDMPDVKTLPDEDLLPVLVRCRDLDAESVTSTLDDILKHTLRKSELAPQEAVDVHTYLRKKNQRWPCNTNT